MELEELQKELDLTKAQLEEKDNSINALNEENNALKHSLNESQEGMINKEISTLSKGNQELVNSHFEDNKIVDLKEKSKYIDFFKKMSKAQITTKASEQAEIVKKDDKEKVKTISEDTNNRFMAMFK